MKLVQILFLFTLIFLISCIQKQAKNIENETKITVLEEVNSVLWERIYRNEIPVISEDVIDKIPI